MLRIVFALFIGLYFSVSVNAQEQDQATEQWSLLFEQKTSESKSLSVDYSTEKREIRLNYHDWEEAQFDFQMRLPVSNNQEVDRAISEVQILFEQRINYDENVMGNLISRLRRLENLNPETCEVLHFSLPGGHPDSGGEGPFGEIISGDIQNLLDFMRGDFESNFFESEKISHFETRDHSYSVFLILDEQGDILRLSFTRDEGDFIDGIVESEDGRYIVRNAEGDLEFILKAEQGDDGVEHILVLYPDPESEENGLLGQHIFLTRGDNHWRSIAGVEVNRDQVEFKESFQLNDSQAEHRPVINVLGSDLYFSLPRDEEIIASLKSYSGGLFSSFPLEQNVGPYREAYLSCILSNGLLDRSRESAPLRETVGHYCSVESELNVVEDELVEVVLSHFSDISSIFENFDESHIRTSFRRCMSDRGVLSRVDDYYYPHANIIVDRDQGAQTLADAFAHCRDSSLESIVADSLSSELSDYQGFIADKLMDEIISELARNCTSSMSECPEMIEVYRDILAALRDLPDSERLVELRTNEEGCFDSGEEGLSCLEEIYTEGLFVSSHHIVRGFSTHSPYLNSSNLSIQGGRQGGLEQSDIIAMSESFNRCISDLTEDDFFSFAQDLEDNLHLCAVFSIRDHSTVVFERILEGLKDEYVLNDLDFENFLSEEVSYFESMIENSESIEDINDSFRSHLMYSLASGVSAQVMNDLESNFGDYYSGDEPSMRVNREAVQYIDQSLAFSVGGGAHQPLRFSLIEFLEDSYEQGQWQAVSESLRSVLLNYHREKSHWLARREFADILELSESRLDDGPDINRALSSIQNCYQQHEESEDIEDPERRSLASVVEKCDYTRMWQVAFLREGEDIESRIALHFPSTTDEANQLSSIKHYLRNCLISYGELSRIVDIGPNEWIQGCRNLSRADTSFQLVQMLLNNYSSFIGQAKTKEAFDDYLQCFQQELPTFDFFSGPSQLTSANNLSLELSLRGRELLAEYFGHESLQGREQLLQVESLLENSASLSNLDFSSCELGLRDHLMDSMEDFILSVFPAEYVFSGDGGSETYREIISRAIDPELIELFIEVSQLHTDEQGYLVFPEGDSSQRIVTPLLARTALRNLVDTLAGSIFRGFYFDRESVERELVIFNHELKNALKWMKQTDRPVQISELQDFFVESELADYLALAEVASSVRNQLLSHISTMAQNERLEFRREVNYRSFASMSSSERETYLEIQRRHNNLRALVREMTESYDFRRILRTSEAQGQELLDTIKQYKLIPRMFGEGEPSTNAELYIDRQVANFMVDDDALGGFAERFVEQVATHHLTQERDSKWRITRWLFYSDGDFEWSNLRTTPSGRRAVRYYAQNILLPNMLDIELSNTAKRHRMDYFKRLLDDAQGEW